VRWLPLVLVTAADDRSVEDLPSHSNAKHVAPSEVEVKGDWVLFHPVYSQEEVKSVDVC
jgi:hypothetical protein